MSNPENSGNLSRAEVRGIDRTIAGGVKRVAKVLGDLGPQGFHEKAAGRLSLPLLTAVRSATDAHYPNIEGRSHPFSSTSEIGLTVGLSIAHKILPRPYLITFKSDQLANFKLLKDQVGKTPYDLEDIFRQNASGSQFAVTWAGLLKGDEFRYHSHPSQGGTGEKPIDNRESELFVNAIQYIGSAITCSLVENVMKKVSGGDLRAHRNLTAEANMLRASDVPLTTADIPFFE